MYALRVPRLNFFSVPQGRPCRIILEFEYFCEFETNGIQKTVKDMNQGSIWSGFMKKTQAENLVLLSL
jgi:hypothetical protein